VHGFGYPIWAATLSWFSGVPVPQLLQVLTPLIGNVFLGLFGFATFRRWLGSDKLGLVAAGVLFLVPELVFTVSRGNHEKLTVSLTLLASLAMLQSFVALFQKSWRSFAGWVSVYYLVAFTLASINVFFGSSFIVASTLVFMFGSLVLRLARAESAVMTGIWRRLLVLVTVSWLLVILVMWYVYPQAGSFLFLLKTVAEKLSLLFLSFNVESNPYQEVGYDWASSGLYSLISSFRWLLLLGSFGVWLILLRQSLGRVGSAPLHQLLLLAIYGAFGFQMAIGIPVDLIGLAAGSNLQVRLYTYFALFAAPVLVLGLTSLLEWLRSRWPRTLLPLVFSLTVAFYSLISLLKATLDPTVSNRWLFYSPTEVRAMAFWREQSSSEPIWVGTSGRLSFAQQVQFPSQEVRDDLYDIGPPDPGTAKLIQTRLESQSAANWSLSLPTGLLGHRVYDNGEAQIFHRLPGSPFQR
jgi:hypothetical protein